MNPKYLGPNKKKRPAPPPPPPTRLFVNHKQIKPLTEGKMRHGVKPQGAQNEALENSGDMNPFIRGLIVGAFISDAIILLVFTLWG